MNEIQENKLNIKSMIYEIRDKQVMLDSDLAKLYGCKNGTKDINKAVKRNLDRFPNDFYFELTKKEYYSVLRFQNGTLELKRGNYSKYNVHVFTEQGVAMLATILRTENASQVSIRIMRTFVEMRKFINENKNIFNRLTVAEYKLLEHDDKIDEIFHDRFIIYR